MKDYNHRLQVMKSGKAHQGKVVPIDSRNATENSQLGDTQGITVSQRSQEPVFDPNPKKFTSVNRGILPPAATAMMKENTNRKNLHRREISKVSLLTRSDEEDDETGFERPKVRAMRELLRREEEMQE